MNIEYREIRHFHFCGGIGGGGLGFNRGEARVGRMVARPRCIGMVDVDPVAVANFERIVGASGTCLDLFDRDQYIAFHGHEPPADWREATPEDIRRAAGNERPNVVFMSTPCKGNSGLITSTKAAAPKYVALNELGMRVVYLAMEAWSDDPPEIILFENVPRIAQRSRALLDRIVKMLHAYGYAVAETTHDCGEIGGLAQTRKRFLMVARHMVKVPPFLYEPPKRPLRSVGEVLEKLPLPGDPAGGPMHRIQRLQWRTWVRLAFVEAGSDWRSLNRLNVVDGHLADFGILPSAEWRDGTLGVLRWEQSSGTVTGNAGPTCGRYSVADPRMRGGNEYGQYGVRRWSDFTGTVINVKSPGQGAHSIADPRAPHGAHTSKYRVTRRDEAAGCVIGASTTGQGAFAVADPRAFGGAPGRNAFANGGHYGVLKMEDRSGAITGSCNHDNGFGSVADNRCAFIGTADTDLLDDLPDQSVNLVAVIRALDDTWHRPFTTLDLAALQSFVDPDEMFTLEGRSDSQWREYIGNAVPPAAAQAMMSVIARTLLLAWSGESFALSSDPIWVQPIATALAVDTSPIAFALEE